MMSWMGKLSQGARSCTAPHVWREWVSQREEKNHFEESVCFSGTFKSYIYLSDHLGCSPRVDFEMWHHRVVISNQEKSDLFPLIPPLLFY